MKRIVCLALVICSVAVASFLAPSNVDPVDKWSWGENLGWMNWRDADATSSGVFVDIDQLSGMIWTENVGWINVGDGTGPYANATGLDFGVNVLPSGDLDGYGWGENIGWLNFGWAVSTVNPDRARFDGGTGRFHGWVWGENDGWINLDDATHFVAASVDTAPSELETPEPDGAGSDLSKNRALSFVIPTGAAAGVAVGAAIQIELAALNHICSADSDNLFQPCTVDDECTNGTCETKFGGYEGQFRYVNTIKTCQGAASSTGEEVCRSLDDCAIDEECLQMRMCDGTTDLCATGDDCTKGVSCLASMSCPDDEFKPPFLCATTGCEPEYRDWASELGGGVLHVFGPGIVPARSEYYLRQIPAHCSGSESNCTFASDLLMIVTARWADMTADGATNAQDITAASDKVKEIPEAFTKPRTILIPGTVDLFRKVNVSELQNTVDAVKSLPMPGFISGPEDCGA